MLIEYVVCPLCGRNSPLSRRDGRAPCDFRISGDTPLVYIRDPGGGRGIKTNLKIIQVINISQAKPYLDIIQMFRNRARTFLDITDDI